MVFCVICLCIFFILRSVDGNSRAHRPGIWGFQDQVSACAGVYAGEAILKDGLKSTLGLQPRGCLPSPLAIVSIVARWFPTLAPIFSMWGKTWASLSPSKKKNPPTFRISSQIEWLLVSARAVCTVTKIFILILEYETLQKLKLVIFCNYGKSWLEQSHKNGLAVRNDCWNMKTSV